MLLITTVDNTKEAMNMLKPIFFTALIFYFTLVLCTKTLIIKSQTFLKCYTILTVATVTL